MPRLSYEDFRGVTEESFFEHCKLLKDDELVEVGEAKGGIADMRLTPKGHDFLDAQDLRRPPFSRRLGFRI